MGTSLNGLTPANTYQALIKVGNNTNLNTTLKTLSDGAGNDLPMQASTNAINFTGTVSGVASGVSGAIQFSNGSAFASDANNLFWDDTNNRLGIGTNVPTTSLQIDYASSSLNGILINQTGGTNNFSSIGFANNGTIRSTFGMNLNSGEVRWFNNSGGYFATIYSNGVEAMRIDGSQNVNIGATALGARVGIKGSGSTSATTSLLVQNSSGNNALQVTDDQMVRGYSGTSLRFRLGTTTVGQGVSTREGEFAVGFIDTNQSSCLRLFVASSTAFSYIDGYTEGASKAQNYAIVFGSRANNTGQVITGSTTQENGSPVVFGSAVVDASALVQINSTTRGFLPPRMTTTEKNAIASPAEGLQMYDSTAKSPAYYDGTNWGYTGGALQNAAGNSGTLNISFAAGNIVNLTLNANTTLAFSNAVIGTYIIQVTQGATGSNLLTYPASVKWAGGTAPTLTTTVGKTDILTFYYDGTNYYGNYSLNY